MTERKDTLRQYVSDMLSVEKHILEAVKRQVGDKRVKEHPEARELIHSIQQTTNRHVNTLDRHLTTLGGDKESPAKPAKEAVTAALGVAAGLVDKVRTDKVSKMLRDDYTALNLAAISYTMLHTTGLALQDTDTAELALEHLKAWTPLITKINEVTPHVVAKELTNVSASVDMNVGQEAVRNTQTAWESEHVHAEHVHQVT